MKIAFEKIEFPLSGPPAGAEIIDRWYQLDPPAAAIVDFWSRARLNDRPRPHTIVLASPHGCNGSDEQFQKSGLSSPQKFVHTLPNVRATPLCQLLGWQGPLLCVQKDPNTFAAGLELAVELIHGKSQPVWVLGVNRLSESAYGVMLFELNETDASSMHLWLSLNDSEAWSRGERMVK